MFRQLKKNLVVTLIAAPIIGQVAPALSGTVNTLPDMETSAGSTLSIRQEMQMGDYYVCQPYGNTLLIDDLSLIQYINALGIRLASHADSVKAPFTFLLISNDEINALALFGGNVVLHSVLFRHSDNESRLAPVMTHGISHIIQRRPARAMEDQRRNAPLAWAGTLGSILLAMASPQAGMVALTDALAGTRWGMISSTQQNGQEANRTDTQVLQRSGFDPQAVLTLLEKLLDQAHYSSRLPKILPAHPLPESRLSDVRNRVNQMRPVAVQSSEDFYLTKA